MSILDELFEPSRQIIDHVDTSMTNSKSRRDMCSQSLELFATTYFPDVFFMPFNDIHREIFASLEDMILRRQDRHNYFARAIPRRSGKSQIVSYLLPLWCICYGYHKNILIVSETQDQAKNFCIGIKTELEENELLQEDFSNLSIGTDIWASDKFLTSNGVYTSCKSMGGRLRGIKYRQNRPLTIVA